MNPALIPILSPRRRRGPAFEAAAAVATGAVNAFDAAFRAMHTAIRAVAAVTVTYWRAGQSVSLDAVVGATVFEIDEGNGVLVSSSARDYLVCASDLVLGGATAEPKRGDRIVETRHGVSSTYEVMGPGGQKAARPSDPYGYAWRIHTKLVKREAA